MKNKHKLSVCILAGGCSRRIGRNKALISFQGRPLIQRIVERVTPIASEIIIIAHQTKDYEFLNLPVVGDKIPGAGVLGGLFTALAVAVSPFVLVLACDIPFVNKDLIQTELELIQAEVADVVIAESKIGLEPLHAVYRRDTCLPYVRQALDAKQRRMISWFEHVRVRIMSSAEVAVFDPNGTAFININTAEDLARAEEKA